MGKQSQSNGAVVTVETAKSLPETPSIGFTLPRALVEMIDAKAKDADISRSEFLREMIASEFKYVLPDAKPRGRASSLAHLSEEERAAEFKRRGIVSHLRNKAEMKAMQSDVMSAAKSGRVLSCDEIEGAILRYHGELIAEYEKKHTVSLAEPAV